MTGIEMIAEKARTNAEHKGYDAAHDDTHTAGEMACASVCYILHTVITTPVVQERTYYRYWPWEREAWKPSDDPIRNLVHAGALIVAEIERLQRLRA